MKKIIISFALLYLVGFAFPQTKISLYMVEDSSSIYTNTVPADAIIYDKTTGTLYSISEKQLAGSSLSKTSYTEAAKQLTNQITVRNIEALRSLRKVNAPAVYVEGYYTEGFGGGWFFWDNTSIEPDNYGTIIKLYNVETGRYKRSYSGSIYVDWFGAHGIANGTSRIQAAFDLQKAGKSNVVEFTAGNTYTIETVTVPSQTNILGHGAKIIPLNNPDQVFLIDAKVGGVRAYRDIYICDFKVYGDAQNIVKIMGSFWGNIRIEYINSISGTGNALVSTDIMLGTNPSGLTLKHLNSYHLNGYKYGFYSVANSTRASLDGLIIEHINIWPTEGGYPVYINHNLSTNTNINNLYHGAGSGKGGGILHVFRMNRGEIGNLWSEASNGDIVGLSGSYRDLDINKIVMQTNTATETDTTFFINAHMFNVYVGKCVLQDDNAAGYERYNTPPDGYTCFKFTVDDAGHISRDVRIENMKGNFNATHLDASIAKNIQYTEQYFNQDVTTTATPLFQI